VFKAGSSAPVGTPDQVTLLDLGLLQVVSDGLTQFQLSQNTAGAFQLTVGGLRVDTLDGGQNRTPLATVSTAGRLELSVDQTLTLGPIQIESVSNPTLVIDLRAAGFSLDLPLTTVRSSLQLAGGQGLWPDHIWTLGPASLDFLQDFEFLMPLALFADDASPPFTFAGFRLGSSANSENYLMFERKDGIFGLRCRAFQSLGFADGDVRFSARSSGDLRGRITGRLRFPPMDLDVGSATLDYDSTRSTYQFRHDTTVLGTGLRFEAGTTAPGAFGLPLGARAGFQ
jgi:hypothetical protein